MKKCIVFCLIFTPIFSACGFYKIPKSKDVLNYITNTTKLNKELNSDFSILVWNIFKGKRQNWNSDFTKISKGIDLLLIQESSLNKKNIPIYQNLKKHSFIHATSFELFGSKNGNANAYKVLPIKHHFIRTKGREPIILSPKITLISYFKLKNNSKLLATANIHSLNFVSASKHMSQLHQLYNKLKSHNGPLIVAGDFNTWTYEKKENLRNFVNSLSLKKVPLIHKDIEHEEVVDFVFYRGLKIKSAKVYNEISSSDHKAIKVKFTQK